MDVKKKNIDDLPVEAASRALELAVAGMELSEMGSLVRRVALPPFNISKELETDALYQSGLPENLPLNKMKIPFKLNSISPGVEMRYPLSFPSDVTVVKCFLYVQFSQATIVGGTPEGAWGRITFDRFAESIYDSIGIDDGSRGQSVTRLGSGTGLGYMHLFMDDDAEREFGAKFSGDLPNIASSNTIAYPRKDRIDEAFSGYKAMVDLQLLFGKGILILPRDESGIQLVVQLKELKNMVNIEDDSQPIEFHIEEMGIEAWVKSEIPRPVGGMIRDNMERDGTYVRRDLIVPIVKTIPIDESVPIDRITINARMLDIGGVEGLAIVLVNPELEKEYKANLFDGPNPRIESFKVDVHGNQVYPLTGTDPISLEEYNQLLEVSKMMGPHSRRDNAIFFDNARRVNGVDSMKGNGVGYYSVWDPNADVIINLKETLSYKPKVYAIVLRSSIVTYNAHKYQIRDQISTHVLGDFGKI